MATKTETVEEYLDAQPESVRAKLEELRSVIRAAAPGATEGISYGVPAFKLGTPLVGYGAAKDHIGLYVMDPAVIVAHSAELADYKTSKGSISLPMNEPIPVDLVRTIVRARVAANEAQRKK